MVAIICGEVPEFVKSSGPGSGYGYGDGSGDGEGSGYGPGDGEGYGYGPGDGYGSKAYWEATIPYFSAKWDQKQRDRLASLSTATIAFWRSDKDGRACNGGKHKSPVHVGLVETIPGPLRICTANGLHATVIPPKYNGERWWIVALTGEVQWQEDKCAALRREILGECV